jgi:hypothetical protein
MDDFARAAFREREARKILRRRAFWLHAAIYLATNIALIVVWALVGGGYPWFVFVIVGWGIGLAAHGAAAFLLASPQDLVLEREQRRLTSEQ